MLLRFTIHDYRFTDPLTAGDADKVPEFLRERCEREETILRENQRALAFRFTIYDYRFTDLFTAEAAEEPLFCENKK